jgi:hypothetical protein
LVGNRNNDVLKRQLQVGDDIEHGGTVTETLYTMRGIDDDGIGVLGLIVGQVECGPILEFVKDAVEWALLGQGLSEVDWDEINALLLGVFI